MDMLTEVSTRINESAKGESGMGPRQPAYSKEATCVGPGRAGLVVGDSKTDVVGEEGGLVEMI